MQCSIMSLCLVLFFIKTSSTTTSDFFDISFEYICKIWFGIAFRKGINPDIYWVRMRLTRMTRLDFTLLTSS